MIVHSLSFHACKYYFALSFDKLLRNLDEVVPNWPQLAIDLFSSTLFDIIAFSTFMDVGGLNAYRLIPILSNQTGLSVK